MAALEILALDEATPQIVAPQTGDTYTAPRAIALTPESLSGSSATSSLDITQAWNTTGTPTAIKVSLTNTASNAASKLIDVQTGGTSQFYVTAALYGKTWFGTNTAVADSAWLGSNEAGSVAALAVNSNGGSIGSSKYLAWRTTDNASAGFDVYLYRDAAATLALRNSTNAQTFNIYNTYTDASNYERFGIVWSGNRVTLDTAEAGTGSARGITIGGADLILASLPTADPTVAGQLWSNSGVLTVSAG